MNRTRTSRPWPVPWQILPLLLIGCGGYSTDYSGLELAEVQGAVTLDGRSLPDAFVVFTAADGRSSTAVTDTQGNYRLQYTSEQAGCLPGVMKVSIRTTPDPDSDAFVPPEDGSPIPQEQVPARYNVETELTVTVEPEGSHTFDFDLTSP